MPTGSTPSTSDQSSASARSVAGQRRGVGLRQLRARVADRRSRADRLDRSRRRGGAAGRPGRRRRPPRRAARCRPAGRRRPGPRRRSSSGGHGSRRCRREPPQRAGPGVPAGGIHRLASVGAGAGERGQRGVRRGVSRRRSRRRAAAEVEEKSTHQSGTSRSASPATIRSDQARAPSTLAPKCRADRGPVQVPQRHGRCRCRRPPRRAPRRPSGVACESARMAASSVTSTRGVSTSRRAPRSAATAACRGSPGSSGSPRAAGQHQPGRAGPHQMPGDEQTDVAETAGDQVGAAAGHRLGPQRRRRCLVRRRVPVCRPGGRRVRRSGGPARRRGRRPRAGAVLRVEVDVEALQVQVLLVGDDRQHRDGGLGRRGATDGHPGTVRHRWPPG